MSGAVPAYRDRFGHEWGVRFERSRNAARRVTFTCGRVRLVAAEGAQLPIDRPPAASLLKELFCDAERVIVYESETWYVGYRHRTGKGGRVQSGIYTRFRSANGEVRYSRQMLQFRQMSDDALCEHLASARPMHPASSRTP